MAKRLIRIPANQLVVSSKKLLNQLANVVLKNGAVSIGYVKVVDENSITLINKRNTTLRFAISDINEIIIDILSNAPVATS